MAREEETPSGHTVVAKIIHFVVAIVPRLLLSAFTCRYIPSSVPPIRPQVYFKEDLQIGAGLRGTLTCGNLDLGLQLRSSLSSYTDSDPPELCSS